MIAHFPTEQEYSSPPGAFSRPPFGRKSFKNKEKPPFWSKKEAELERTKK
jgi:hypothetical protein